MAMRGALMQVSGRVNQLVQGEEGFFEPSAEVTHTFELAAVNALTERDVQTYAIKTERLAGTLDAQVGATSRDVEAAHHLRLDMARNSRVRRPLPFGSSRTTAFPFANGCIVGAKAISGLGFLSLPFLLEPSCEVVPHVTSWAGVQPPGPRCLAKAGPPSRSFGLGTASTDLFPLCFYACSGNRRQTPWRTCYAA
eukprot:88611-Amphidinium_carterae.2